MLLCRWGQHLLMLVFCFVLKQCNILHFMLHRCHINISLYYLQHDDCVVYCLVIVVMHGYGSLETWTGVDLYGCQTLGFHKTHSHIKAHIDIGSTPRLVQNRKGISYAQVLHMTTWWAMLHHLTCGLDMEDKLMDIALISSFSWYSFAHSYLHRIKIYQKALLNAIVSVYLSNYHITNMQNIFI